MDPLYLAEFMAELVVALLVAAVGGICALIITIVATSFQMWRKIREHLLVLEERLTNFINGNNKAHGDITKDLSDNCNEVKKTNDLQWKALGVHGERIASLEERCEGD